MLPGNAMGFDIGTTRGSRNVPGQSLMAWAENLGYFNSSMSPGSKVSMSTRTGQWSPVANDPYTYACGSPTLKNRRKYMSLDQLFALCKELKIMPETEPKIEEKAETMLAGSSTLEAKVFGFTGCYRASPINGWGIGPRNTLYPKQGLFFTGFVCFARVSEDDRHHCF